MKIRKRNGGYEELSVAKVQRALVMAFQGGRYPVDPMPLVHRVMGRVAGVVGDVDVAGISDLIEEVLLDAGHTATARRFIRYRAERDLARLERASAVGLSGEIGDYIHVAKYAKHIALRRESRDETIDRVEAMHTGRWPELAEEIASALAGMRDRRLVCSMRMAQFAGEAVLRDNARGYNCAFGHVSRWRFFQEAFYLLLCGCGVGYSVQWRHVDQLSVVVGPGGGGVVHHTVADTIIGWADAVGALISSYIGGSGEVVFNYSQIRGEGVVLRTSGGRAPGHKPLARALEALRVVLDGCIGRRIRPIEAHDMLCHLAEAVLSGGIRRASLLSLFSVGDTEMLYCKARGVFEPGRLNDHRQMANNSAALLRSDVGRDEFARLLEVAHSSYGDPGFYFCDDLDWGPNPCGEIQMYPLFDGEAGISFCNLTEVNLASCTGEGDFIARCVLAARLGTFQAAYDCFGYLGEVTERIVRRDALLGVSLTAIMDVWGVPWLTDDVLERGRAAVVEENARVAGLLGINPAARLTTVKPSGTASLWLGGVGSGIHPRWSRRYIQRVTANKNERVATFFRAVNPHAVETTPSGDLKLCFPIEGEGRTVESLGALEHLDIVRRVFGAWIGGRGGHNVSCTIALRSDVERNDVIEWVWEHRGEICALSFVPLLIDERFPYAPREAIRPHNEERWNTLVKLWRKVDWSLYSEPTDETSFGQSAACAGGVCEII